MLAEVCGKVVYVNAKNRSIFHIYAKNADKKFSCRYNNFLPLRVGDALIGIAEITDKSELIFSDPPFVIMGKDKETILELFMTALRGTGFNAKKAESIYNILLSKCGDNILSDLDYISTCLNSNYEVDLNIKIDDEYYKILEIEKGVNETDIKKAYYKLARENHPDKASDKDEATKRFQKISEAYEILSNTEQREIYDSFGKEGLKGERRTPFVSSFGTEPYIPFSMVIDNKQFNKLMNYYYKNRVLRNLYLLGLNNKEINSSQMNPLKLYEKCLENPYLITSLALDKCDDILARCGKSVDERFRECGKIVRKISDMMENNGWTCVPSNTLLRMFPKIKEYLPLLKDEFGIVTELHSVYLAHAHEVETSIGEWIKDLLTSPPICVLSNITYTRNDLAEDQKTAILNALNNNISIITGPGGSGKTICLKELVYNLEKNGIPYRLGSFTGKAVARIREVTERKEPATLHMMIATSKDRKKEKDASFKYLIIDEGSMVTTDLLYQFRRNFSHDYRLVFVGDVNQLEPIGWGNLFSSLIKTKIVPTTILRKVHRTGDYSDNGILINSKRIVEHKDPEYDGPPFEFEVTGNFKIISGDLSVVKSLVEVLNNNGIDPSNIVIISPYNRDLEIINENSSNLYNGLNRSIVDARGKKWRIGDRAMMVCNNYKYNLMTGDEGIVIDCDDDSINVKYKESTHKYFTCSVSEDDEGCKELNTNQLIHSFAVSTHRYQGSESEYVIGYIPQGKPSSTFLNSNLLYTLITRAKKILWLIGDIETMVRAATTSPKTKIENLTSRILSL